MKKALLISSLLAITLLNSPAAPPAVVERGPNHRVWERVTDKVHPSRKVTKETNSYVELATGLHYQKDGQWVESKEEIELFKSGAVARQGQHQVIFAPNLNTEGAIDMQTPDGKRLKSQILGLSYYDTATGKSVLIAELKDSTGELHAPNQITYPDAFTDLKADVRYTYTKGGFSQDIILRENPPSPSEYGLDPQSTRLEVLTEFTDPPVPEKTTRPASAGAAMPAAPVFDESLNFGAMQIGKGKAFSLGGKSRKKVPVSKIWTRMEGRDFLIESVDFMTVKPQLEALPRPGEASLRRAEKLKELVQKQNGRMAPVRHAAVLRKSESMRLAKADPAPRQGFVLDYESTATATNFTFRSDTTYYVSGPVILSGTTTLEGGAVVKFASTNYPYIVVSAALNCQTDAYHPAVFTSKNDNTVGEPISGSTGNPGNQDGLGLILQQSNTSLSNVRFSHLFGALTMEADVLRLSDVQFSQTQYPIDATDAYTIYIDNALFYQTEILASDSTAVLRGQHWTVNQSRGLLDSGDLYLTNSLLIDVTNLFSTITTTDHVARVSSASGIFQSVGAGLHYLDDNSGYRNIGTTNISTNLLAALRLKTTYPPTVLTNIISVDTTLSPAAQRDTDIPDLGYHYAPLDYLMSGVVVSNNATL